MNPSIQLKATSSLLIALGILGFALLPKAQAVVPPPDGGYPGGNTAEGENALFSLSNGQFNAAVGLLSLHSLTTGNANTAVGAGTLFSNDADGNTAVGAGALLFTTTGAGNTANGAFALLNNTVGAGNTAVGAGTLFFNTVGAGNTAVGTGALHRNAGGPQESSLNTAVGLDALGSNTTGNGNTAVGAGTNGSDDPVGPAALGSNTTGGGNTAVGATKGVGAAALGRNTTGEGNTAIGAGTLLGNAALGSNTTGEGNTAMGQRALNSNTTGSNNVAVGVNAGDSLTTGDNNIDIGNSGVADESATTRIGSEFQTRTFISAIRGVTTGIADAVNVVIDSNGQLGTMSSSARFKKDIKPMDKASEAVLALKPVTFHYKSDSANIPQFGLIAEEVEKVDPDLVVRDGNGEIYTVRHDAVNAMLLNEFLKEHRKVQELTKDFQATVAQLTSRLDEQAALIQKVSAQLEASKPAPQVVNNP